MHAHVFVYVWQHVDKIGMYVCMYVCVCVCERACVRACARTHARMYVCMFVRACKCASVRACMYVASLQEDLDHLQEWEKDRL